jgi:hypothetical protein
MIGNFPKCTPARDFHVTFKIRYVYYFIKSYAGKNQNSYKIIITEMFPTIDKAKPHTENIKDFNLAKG